MPEEDGEDERRQKWLRDDPRTPRQPLLVAHLQSRQMRRRAARGRPRGLGGRARLGGGSARCGRAALPAARRRASVRAHPRGPGGFGAADSPNTLTLSLRLIEILQTPARARPDRPFRAPRLSALGRPHFFRLYGAWGSLFGFGAGRFTVYAAPAEERQAGGGGPQKRDSPCVATALEGVAGWRVGRLRFTSSGAA